MYDNEQITPIGITDWRNVRQPFGIWDKDRLSHIYIIGKSGTGKSTLISNMAISDIQKGKGLCVLDPHGDLAQSLLTHIPEHRRQELVYFDPGENIIAYNPLYNIPKEYHHLVSSGLISTFKKIWADSWGPRMEYILRFSLLTLLEYPEATLLDINRLLTHANFRANVLVYVHDPFTLSFWQSEFDKYSPTYRNEIISPILNKFGIFASSIPLRTAIGKVEDKLQLKEAMEKGKIVIVNLSKGMLGEEISSLLGSMLINSLHLCALQRATIEISTRRPFFLYVDEIHSFATLSFADILAEARKYGLGICMAHQYIEQLPEKLRSAVFGNVGTLVSFRVGAEDAKVLTQEFCPVFTEVDFVHLPKYSMYIKLMIDGATSKPFSAKAIAISLN